MMKISQNIFIYYNSIYDCSLVISFLFSLAFHQIIGCISTNLISELIGILI